jgi:hypothetical protein
MKGKMKYFYARFIFLYFLILALPGMIFLAHAQSPNPPGGVQIPGFFTICTGTGSDSGFVCILNRILNTLLIISTPIVAILVVIGGIQIMTAAGNTEKITKGKQTITYAVIGFAIILLATSVVPVLKSLLG